MKRIFYFIVLITISYAAAGQDRENTGLFATLEHYNKTVVYKTDESTVEGRRWWQNLLNVCALAGADIVGAAAGVKSVGAIALGVGAATGGTGAVLLTVGAGVVTGAGASYIASHQLPRTAVSGDVPVKYGNLTIEVPRKYAGFSRVGIMHNDVIHNNFVLGHPLDPFLNSFLDEKQKAIIQSNEMATARELIEKAAGEYARNGFDVKAYTNELYNAGMLTPDSRRVLELFMDKYTTCWEPPNIEHIVNFYMKEVANSALTENEQHALAAAFMVASESPFYFLEN